MAFRIAKILFKREGGGGGGEQERSAILRDLPCTYS